MQEFITIPTYLLNIFPPDKFYALADILSMADEKGEIKVSTPVLMTRWKWGNTKVRNFIDSLVEKGICTQETNKPTNKETNKKQTSRQTRVLLVNTRFFALSQTKSQTINKQADKQGNKQVKEQKAGQEETPKYLPSDTKIHKRIIDYFNKKCNRQYGYNNPSTISYINERLEQGYTENDFYVVIDKKSDEWLGDSEMDKYLTPKTLFHNHFEDYLKQKTAEHRSKSQQDLENFYRNVDEWVNQKELKGENYDI